MPGETCNGYAELREPDQEDETLVCAEQQRISHTYVSKGNVVVITFTTNRDGTPTENAPFLWKYEGIKSKLNVNKCRVSIVCMTVI